MRWIALLGIACLMACGAETSVPRARMVARAHMSMGSEVRVTAWTSDEAIAHAAMTKVFAEFDRLDALLSIWKPGSDVLRLNAAAGRAAIAVSAETREVLQTARQLSEWTDGKFDITFGALADVWKFDHDQDNRVPTPAEIAARRPLVNYRSVVVDDTAGTAYISRAGARVHLGGIGKGYAVDRAVAILRASGLRDFMVQAGGDLFVAGQSGDGPWRLGIQDPRGAPNESFATIELRDRTLSTSGDYERFFIQNGQRYHHILDPATGEPARASVSVTIIATTATMADGLSKGVFILGPKAGMALVERLPDVEAVIVDASNQMLISRGLQGANVGRPFEGANAGRPFMGRLEILHTPTNARP